MTEKPTSESSAKRVESYMSWGRVLRPKHHVETPLWSSQIRDCLENSGGSGSVLCFGKGRSYGDLCINDQASLIDMSHLDNFVSLDTDTGILRCEAGVTLGSILEVIVPKGLFIPVSPGTKFVTLGGAIASDVHGKNHHVAGNLGNHILSFDLLRSDGTLLTCTPTENEEMFRATIGGMGLTGIILNATIQLKKTSAYFDVELIKFANLKEFFHLNDESEQNFDYTVAWVDCISKGDSLGRGIYMRGNHSSKQKPFPRPKTKALVPFDFPNLALNPLSISLFNHLYYGKQRQKKISTVQNYDSFFYPLDSINHWNRIYGKRGFFQYQFVIGKDQQETLENIFKEITNAGLGSFLAVLKTFGSIKSPGLMSFPKEGYTLALDFANQKEATKRLFTTLDSIIRGCGGRLYPAKDAHMSADFFKESYPEFERFTQSIDPKFSSSFWRRVTND